MSRSALRSHFLSTLALLVHRSLRADVYEDFAAFSFRYPSPDQFEAWCVDTLDHIKKEPVDESADAGAVHALGVVLMFLELLSGDDERAKFTHDFWRAFADVSAIEEACRALNALDRDGDEGPADQAAAAAEARYAYMSS